jgi:hypothetical protein
MEVKVSYGKGLSQLRHGVKVSSGMGLLMLQLQMCSTNRRDLTHSTFPFVVGVDS